MNYDSDDFDVLACRVDRDTDEWHIVTDDLHSSYQEMKDVFEGLWLGPQCGGCGHSDYHMVSGTPWGRIVCDNCHYRYPIIRKRASEVIW